MQQQPESRHKVKEIYAVNGLIGLVNTSSLTVIGVMKM